MIRNGRDKLDVVTANRDGQQLFLANLFADGSPFRPAVRAAVTPQAPRPVRHEQLLLFTMGRSLATCPRALLPPPPDPILAAELEERTRAYAAERRWSKKQTDETRYGVRILLGLQDTPGTAIKATEVLQLRSVALRTWTVLEVLAGRRHAHR
jgi:hypothetical protein